MTSDSGKIILTNVQVVLNKSQVIVINTKRTKFEDHEFPLAQIVKMKFRTIYLYPGAKFYRVWRNIPPLVIHLAIFRFHLLVLILVKVVILKILENANPL